MLQRAALAATAAAFSALLTEAAPAQPAPAPQPPAASQDERLERLERRLDELDRKHQDDLKARDEEIARLRSQLPTRSPPQTQLSPSRDDQIERTRREILEDIEHDHRAPATGAAPRPSANFNPDITVIADFATSFSPGRDNDAYNRADVREAELDLRAAVHPRADGVVILAIARDVENPVFPEAGLARSGPETAIHVEEAYLLVHDTGVPNLTAKFGRFHVRFGRQNMLHLHDLPTTDPSFVNQAFLAPESLSDAGASLSYVIPPDRIGGQYVEVIGEVLAGEGAGSESPTLSGDLTTDSPAFNTHVLWNTDLPRNVNFELGGSWLTGHAGADNAHRVNLLGLDATLLFRDPSGGFRNALLQSEVMYAFVDADEGTGQAFGAYLLGQQQFNRDWYAGVRLDYTEDPNDDTLEVWGVTPYASWYWTEFLRFRLSYQHRDGDRPAEDAVFFQLTWMFGAHPSHPYWASFH
jgi:hypothetical protein